METQKLASDVAQKQRPEKWNEQLAKSGQGL